MRDLLKKEKGFTLIEIVLVLAIAGLLLVIVFLAVSGAQKSRRDSQRKNDLSRLSAQIESYASNASGSYPSSLGIQGFSTYVPSNFKDPSTGNNYSFTSSLSTAGDVVYTIGSGVGCDGTSALSQRKYKVEMKLEQGTACVDNI